MIAYRLQTYVSGFQGTDHESSRDLRIICYSKSKETLEEISKILFSSDGYNRYDRVNRENNTDYENASYDYYNGIYKQKNHRKGLSKFPVTLSSGKTIEVDVYPVDDYYGYGAIGSVDIEEFEFISPDDFI